MSASGVIRCRKVTSRPDSKSSTTASLSWSSCTPRSWRSSRFSWQERRLGTEAGPGARRRDCCLCRPGHADVFEYSARQIKQSVVGTGAADKAQVQHMVKVLLKLPAEPAEDAADALAAALCHAHTQQSMINMAGATSVRRRRIR